jgi:hypothetical protein
MTDNTEINDIEQIQEEGTDTPIQEETLNSEPVIEELEPIPNPWDNAPENVYFYEKMYPDGHLGSFTQSAELAYKSGWDLNNYIAISDTQQSDINGWTYRKELCPMKTEEDKLKDQYRLEITQLKKQLSDTDYKAIKYAEGQISEEEYASVRELRQSYRDRINYLEGLM